MGGTWKARVEWCSHRHTPIPTWHVAGASQPGREQHLGSVGGAGSAWLRCIPTSVQRWSEQRSLTVSSLSSSRERMAGNATLPQRSHGWPPRLGGKRYTPAISNRARRDESPLSSSPRGAASEGRSSGCRWTNGKRMEVAVCRHVVYVVAPSPTRRALVGVARTPAELPDRPALDTRRVVALLGLGHLRRSVRRVLNRAAAGRDAAPRGRVVGVLSVGATFGFIHGVNLSQQLGYSQTVHAPSSRR